MEWLASRSFRFEARELDHFAPLFGFVPDELAEIGGRERERRDAQIGKLRPELGIGKAGSDFFVKFVDDFDRGVLGRDNAAPAARFVTRHRCSDRRDVGQVLLGVPQSSRRVLVACRP